MKNNPWVGMRNYKIMNKFTKPKMDQFIILLINFKNVVLWENLENIF